MEKILGQYRIVREIGKGGMGIVYQGTDMVNHKAVAVKILPPYMVDRSTVERFSREVQALIRLKHPHIVEAYHFGAQNGEHFFVMEYVEGETVKSLIRQKGALDTKLCVDIVMQTAEALAFAHREHSMSHRDVKPENIVLQKNGNVKLMDFGLVQIPDATRVTMASSTVGTVEYMSPEQAAGGEIDTRTDIYSLGVSLYEMLTGRLPFQGENFQAIMMKHKYETPPSLRSINPRIPVELEAIVNKAMTKDVASRYQKMDHFLDDISAFSRIKGNSRFSPQSIAVGQTVIMDRLVPPTRKKTDHKRKNFSKIFIIVGSFVVILAVSAFFFSKSGLWEALEEKFLSTSSSEDLSHETASDMENLERADKYYQNGLVLLGEERVQEAIDAFKQTINLRSDYALYHKDLALAYEQNKTRSLAVMCWKNVLKYDRDGEFRELANSHLERLK